MKKKLSLSVIVPISRSIIEVVKSVKKVELPKDTLVEFLFISQIQPTPKELLAISHNPLLKFHYFPNKSVSAKRNLGIKKALGKILCFIDDDCIPKNDWLIRIRIHFKKNSSAAALFGKTTPYGNKSKQGLYCPGTFSLKDSRRKRFMTVPNHAEEIGISNNFAIDANLMRSVGGFNTWFGPGTLGASGEDTELITRLIKKRVYFDYDNDLVVRHNKWLGQIALMKLDCTYIQGALFAHTFHYLRGSKDSLQQLKNFIDLAFKGVLFSLKELAKNPTIIRPTLHYLTTITYRVFLGLLLGFVYSFKKEPHLQTT